MARPRPSKTRPSSAYRVFSDGGADPNPGDGGWGAVVIAPDGSRRELRGGEAETTNNRMELRAALEGIKATPEEAVVHVVTDSRYVQKGMSEWVEGWAARGWRLKSGEPVKNEELWRELLAACAHRTVHWSWTKGHAGHRDNERADALATEGRERSRRARGEAPAGEGAKRGEAPAPGAPGPSEVVRATVGVVHTRRGGAWVALLEAKGREKVLGEFSADAPANRLHLLALERTLAILRRPVTVELLTNLSYLRDGATRWLDGWVRKGFRQRGGQTVAHADLWRSIAEALETHRVVGVDPKTEDALAALARAKEFASERLDEATKERQGDKEIPGG